MLSAIKRFFHWLRDRRWRKSVVKRLRAQGWSYGQETGLWTHPLADLAIDIETWTVYDVQGDEFCALIINVEDLLS